jgi:hypothetical protein
MFVVPAMGVSAISYLIFWKVYLSYGNSEENNVEFYWFSKGNKMCLDSAE